MNIQRSFTFDDVLIVPNYNGVSSRDEVDLGTQLGEYKFNIPIISANMDTITGGTMAYAMHSEGGLGILHRFNSIEDNVADFKYLYAEKDCLAGVSVGVGAEGEIRAAKLYTAGARLFCVDIAHAHSKAAGEMVEYIKALKGTFVIAGNVATREGAEYLATKGADAVKVGIGAGSVCTTREKTGVGVPQLTAIMDCAAIGVPIIADGGMRKPSDIAKALAAGARMVMLGGMLAGTNETPISTTYRGSAAGQNSDGRYVEGVTRSITPRGPVSEVIKEVCEGLRSAFTYVGARNLEQFHRKAHFIEVTHAVATEGTAHF